MIKRTLSHEDFCFEKTTMIRIKYTFQGVTSLPARMVESLNERDSRRCQVESHPLLVCDVTSWCPVMPLFPVNSLQVFLDQDAACESDLHLWLLHIIADERYPNTFLSSQCPAAPPPSPLNVPTGVNQLIVTVSRAGRVDRDTAWKDVNVGEQRSNK